MFGFGLLGLGLLAQSHHAVFIQAKIKVRAAQSFAVVDSVHNVQTAVSGRDITVIGYADTLDEKKLLLAQLNQINGRRTVVDELDVLPSISPYVFSAHKTSFQTTYDGLVPTENARDMLRLHLDDAADNLLLASGSPDRAWPAVVNLSLEALDTLLRGELHVQDRHVRLTGLAHTPEVKAYAETVLLGVPIDYVVETDLDIYIDDRPADFELLYSVIDGVSVNGRVPAGMNATRIAEILNVREVSGDIDRSILSDSGLAQSQMRVLAYWLPDLESARLKIDTESMEFDVTLPPAMDRQQVYRSLQTSLFPDTIVTVETTDQPPQPGTVRLNASNRRVEEFYDGYWLPVVSFEPTPEQCQQHARQALAQRKITFVAGSDQLHVQSSRAINSVAAILRHCTTHTDVTIALEGYVDRPGNATQNAALRQGRAMTLRQALLDRGISGDAIAQPGRRNKGAFVATTNRVIELEQERIPLGWSGSLEAETEAEDN